MPVDAFSMIAEKLGFLLTDRCNYMCIFRMPNNPEFISLGCLRAGGFGVSSGLHVAPSYPLQGTFPRF